MLERFQRKHKIIPGEKPSAEFFQRFESRLPEYLILAYKEFGFFATSDSFLFLINPDESEYLQELGFITKKAVAFLRTSFGDVFTWENNRCNHIMVNDGIAAAFGANIELFFESTLFGDELLDGVLYWKLHKKAMKRIKRLDSDECLAFVPAFALGGSSATSEIEKVKLREHLLFLSQLTGKPQRVNFAPSDEAVTALIDAYDREHP